MDELTETDIRSVMATPAGRHVLRWILNCIRPAAISGQNCVANAALHDAANILEETLFSIDPSAWTASTQEAAMERLAASQEKDNA